MKRMKPVATPNAVLERFGTTPSRRALPSTMRRAPQHAPRAALQSDEGIRFARQVENVRQEAQEKVFDAETAVQLFEGLLEAKLTKFTKLVGDERIHAEAAKSRLQEAMSSLGDNNPEEAHLLRTENARQREAIAALQKANKEKDRLLAAVGQHHWKYFIALGKSLGGAAADVEEQLESLEFGLKGGEVDSAVLRAFCTVVREMTTHAIEFSENSLAYGLDMKERAVSAN